MKLFRGLHETFWQIVKHEKGVLGPGSWSEAQVTMNLAIGI